MPVRDRLRRPNLAIALLRRTLMAMGRHRLLVLASVPDIGDHDTKFTEDGTEYAEVEVVTPTGAHFLVRITQVSPSVEPTEYPTRHGF